MVGCGGDDSGTPADESETIVTNAVTSATSGGSSTGAETGDPASTSGAATTDPSGSATAPDDTSGGPPAIPEIIFDVSTVPDAPATGNCFTGVNEDFDEDGFSQGQGDCNDCDPNVNPGAVEVIVTEPDKEGNIPEPADEDCDGEADNVLPPCDGALPIDDAGPYNGAAAIGLCKQARNEGEWGIVNAEYTRADGTPLTAATPQHGLLFDFGPNVPAREGSQMLVLSSGRSRLPGQPDVCGNTSCTGLGAGTPPMGFPQNVPGCPSASAINDDIALELTLRAPTNATGFSFDFDFYSFEYPQWVCDDYNDQFVAVVDPPPEGSILGNVSFDAMTNPVSVNIAFFEVCDMCPLGTAEMDGTGFDTWDFSGAGATSWLVTTAPVEPGEEFTIRFTIWDTGDLSFDSTVLIDNFQWIADGGTVSVGTNPAG